ncbi:hypothetical protein [Sphingobacterium sp. 1.A.5]|uniref:hypothetical protein n=1 Tax=Sphingobacterium sp. 1.A.5 TaxID=2044604 RepID=UPI000C0BC7F5|nr:hypothetical protein [Sphingobacterium sp. 1.A.5]
MITISKHPYKYSANESPIIFEFTSDLPTTLYFEVLIKKAVSNEIIQKLKVFIPPTSNKNFIDISRFLNNYTFTPIVNNNQTITNLDGTIGYYLQVKGLNAVGLETDPTVTSSVFYSFKGITNKYISDNASKYLVQSGQLASFLSDIPTASKIHHNIDTYLYFLADSSSQLANFVITTTLTTGEVITKNVPFTNLTNKQLHCFRLSISKIAEENDVFTNMIRSVKIAGFNQLSEQVIDDYTFYVIAYKCSDDIINIHWLNELGGIDSHPFGNVKKSISVVKNTMQSNQILSVINGVYTELTKAIGVDKTVTYTAISAPLGDMEYDIISKIIASKKVFVETLNGFVPVMISNSSMEVLQKRATKRFNRINISFTVTNDINISTYTDISASGFDYVLDFGL